MLDRSVAAKGPTVVAPGSAGASGGDGKPRMRRTTNIVKRENKMRNAILAGDTAFSCAPITRHLASLLTHKTPRCPLPPTAAHHQTCIASVSLLLPLIGLIRESGCGCGRYTAARKEAAAAGGDGAAAAASPAASQSPAAAKAAKARKAEDKPPSPKRPKSQPPPSASSLAEVGQDPLTDIKF